MKKASDLPGENSGIILSSLKQDGAIVPKNNLLIWILAILTGFVCPVFLQDRQPAAAEKPPAKAKPAHPEVPRMPAQELVQMLKKKADLIIVDTQARDGYEMWHIPSALNIPYDSLANPMDRQLILIELPMDKQIVIYCLCEEGADSAKMALEMRQLGFRKENVKVLEGGLVLWDEKGYPMVKQKVAD